MLMDLITAARQAGIVGAGGAGFPTHVKLDAKADTVIINCAECEPLLRVDQQLAARNAGNLLQILDLMVEQVGAKQGVVALKAHYHDAIVSLEKELSAHPKLSVFPLGSFYPAGDEQVIVAEVTGRIVPEGGLPVQVGVVVSNVETALNLCAAGSTGTPVTDKYVTLTGAVRTPKTVKVPLGITVRETLALAGGPTVEDCTVINGGPMMGKIVSMNSFITKTTKGLIVLDKSHPLIASIERPLSRSLRDAAIACMQCSMCMEVCPRANLNHRIHPHKLMRMAAYGSMCDRQETPMNAFLCSGCRLCEYACVMGLQPWKLNGNFKTVMSQNGVRNNLHNTPEKPAPFRETKRYPLKKLIYQLGLDRYDVPAPIDDTLYDATEVNLLLRQNVGAAANPVVAPGDQVKKGALVAHIPDGSLSANLHASISGTVAKITKEAIVIKA